MKPCPMKNCTMNHKAATPPPSSGRFFETKAQFSEPISVLDAINSAIDAMKSAQTWVEYGSLISDLDVAVVRLERVRNLFDLQPDIVGSDYI